MNSSKASSAKSPSLSERLRYFSVKKSKTLTFSSPDLDRLNGDSDDLESETKSASHANIALRKKRIKRTTSMYKLNRNDSESLLSASSRATAFASHAFNCPPCIVEIATKYDLSDEQRDLVFKMFNLDYYNQSEVSKMLVKLLNDTNEAKSVSAYFALFSVAGINLYSSLKLMSQKFDFDIETNFIEDLVKYFSKAYHLQNYDTFRSADDVRVILLEMLALNTKIQLVGLKNVVSVDNFTERISRILETNLYDECIRSCYASITRNQLYLRSGPFYADLPKTSPIYSLDLSQADQRIGDIYFMGYQMIRHRQFNELNPMIEFSKDKNRQQSQSPYLMVISRFYILLVNIEKCELSSKPDEKFFHQMYKKKLLPTVNSFVLSNFSTDTLHVIKLMNCQIPVPSYIGSSFKLFAVSNGQKIDEYKFVYELQDDKKAQIQPIHEIVTCIRFLSAINTLPFDKTQFSELKSAILTCHEKSKSGTATPEDIKRAENEAFKALYTVNEVPCTLCMKCTYELNYKADVKKAMSDEMLAMFSTLNIGDGTVNLRTDSKTKKQKSNLAFVKTVSGVLMHFTQMHSIEMNVLSEFKYPRSIS